MKRIAYTFCTGLALLAGSADQVLAAQPIALDSVGISAASSRMTESPQPPGLSLRLESADAEKLGADTLTFNAAERERYTYALFSGNRSVLDMDIYSYQTDNDTQDVITCDFAGTTAQIWYSERGESGASGAERDVDRCFVVARQIGNIVENTPIPSWDGAGSLAPVDPGSLEAGVNCQVATVGEHAGKCMCKCDHGWSPAGALFCSGFYLTMEIFGDGCHVGIGCEAPLSACTN